MPKSKTVKTKKSKATPWEHPESKKSRQVLVQVRIPEDEHKLLTKMCKAFGQSIALRVRGVIKQELEEGYPFTLVNLGDGSVLQTWFLVEKVSMPDRDEYAVRVLPEDAVGIFPDVLDREFNITMPRRTPKIFKVESRYVDAGGSWHLHLKKIGSFPA